MATLWKVVNAVSNPNKERKWKIKTEEDVVLTDEKQIAETFNDYFVNKIDTLKEDIDQSLICDPLDKLAKKMANKRVSH